MAREAPAHNPLGDLPVQAQEVIDSAHGLPEPFSPASNVTDGQSPQTGLEHSDSSKTARRRNKPSLSCQACTNKKTKCDRGRPKCLACLKRRSECNYSELADAIELVSKYFHAVDPVYPMIHRETFENDYNHFWVLTPTERTATDASLVALIFVMLAMGTQFVDLPSMEEKEQTAEFYALRMFSYLGRPSMRSIQTMVLITYFLMNDNHASDAWAFAGILQRQAYALGLNRDPSTIQPNAHPLEMQQRRKVWQAVFIQDTFLSVIIKLPPTVTHNDVRIEDLLETEDSSFEHGATDTSFIRNRAICQNASERQGLIAHFQRLYHSFPLPFRTLNETAICELARRSRRTARQTLFLTSNYYHCLMLINADQHEEMACDIRATLEAAHEAIASFFLFHTIFDGEAGVWFHFQHRAFSEADIDIADSYGSRQLIIADLVKSKPPESTMDSVYVQAKTDLIKMVGMMQMNSEHDIVARTRMGVLSSYL
ncbi:MAG: hypothetical protein Q9194_001322 [Teloschistes cf. exilis]